MIYEVSFDDGNSELNYFLSNPVFLNSDIFGIKNKNNGNKYGIVKVNEGEKELESEVPVKRNGNQNILKTYWLLIGIDYTQNGFYAKKFFNKNDSLLEYFNTNVVGDVYSFTTINDFISWIKMELIKTSDFSFYENILNYENVPIDNSFGAIIYKEKTLLVNVGGKVAIFNGNNFIDKTDVDYTIENMGEIDGLSKLYTSSNAKYLYEWMSKDDI